MMGRMDAVRSLVVGWVVLAGLAAASQLEA